LSNKFIEKQEDKSLKKSEMYYNQNIKNYYEKIILKLSNVNEINNLKSSNVLSKIVKNLNKTEGIISQKDKETIFNQLSPKIKKYMTFE